MQELIKKCKFLSEVLGFDRTGLLKRVMILAAESSEIIQALKVEAAPEVLAVYQQLEGFSRSLLDLREKSSPWDNTEIANLPSFKEELADVAIVVLALAGQFDIDLSTCVEEKLRILSTRKKIRCF